eukprot:scaffold50793_cov22-Tisochrysis_lutea.AAC.4
MQKHLACTEEIGSLTTYSNHSPLSMATLPATQFWVGYKTDENGGLVAVDGKDSSYVAARMKNDLSNGCVFGDKMRTVVDQPLTVDFDTFAATPTSGCKSKRPYMCERSDCSICDTCVERVYDQVCGEWGAPSVRTPAFCLISWAASLKCTNNEDASLPQKLLCHFTSKVAGLEDPTVSQVLDGTSGFRGWKVLCEEEFEAENCREVSVLIAASVNNEVYELMDHCMLPATVLAIATDGPASGHWGNAQARGDVYEGLGGLDKLQVAALQVNLIMTPFYSTIGDK